MARTSRRQVRRAAAFTVATAAAFAAWAPTASAATTASVPCSTRSTAKKFLAVDGDINSYFTAPAGTFEAGATGWALANSSVVTGNEPRYINGAGQSRSLKVNSGGLAVTPIFCNAKGEALVRFFYKGSAGARIHLHIDVTNTTSNLNSPLDWEVPVAANGGWVAASGINVPWMYSGDNTENMQLRFSAVGGSVQVDDVEIDPWKSL